MAISQGLLLWLLINLENNVQFQQNIWKRSLENYSERCSSHTNRELNSFLWFMDRNPPVYFFGTIHVPYTKVWDYIPLNSKRAFKTASGVYFELDLTNQENLKTLEQCKTLPYGGKLRDVLPTTLYKRIKTHLLYIRRKLPKWIPLEQKLMGLSPIVLYQKLTKNWHRKRPVWVMLLLDKLTEYHVKLLAQRLPVLDTYLMREAQTNYKKLGSIESVEEQCDVLNKLNSSQVLIALNQTLIMREKIRRGEGKLQFSTKQMIYHYNCGDLKDALFSQDISSIANLENISESNSVEKEQTRRFEEYMKEELFYKRNKKMANRIVNIIKKEQNRKLMFALGAGHFLGNKSIISILQRRGYNITHLKARDSLPTHGRNRKEKACRKRKEKKRRRNGKKQKRRRYRSRKHCNNITSRDQIISSTPTTKACTSCKTARDSLGLKDAISSSASTGGFKRLWSVTLVPFLVFKLAGV